MVSPRRQSRILAMQALCQWDVQQDQTHEALEGFLHAEHPDAKIVNYARQLVAAFWRQQNQIDERISAALVNWELSRVTTVERNVMRVAVVESLSGDVPVKVALDEAIELGKLFGGEQSPRFINGVLDKVLTGEQPSPGEHPQKEVD